MLRALEHVRPAAKPAVLPRLVVSSGKCAVSALFALSLLRFIVLLAESRAVLISERATDDNLVKLCSAGAARESAHMRTACMEAMRQRASPILARSITRAAYSFASELYVTLSEPFQAGSMMGLVGLISLIPWISSLRNLFKGSDDAQRPAERTVVLLQNGELTNHPWHTLDIYNTDDTPGLRQRRSTPLLKDPRPLDTFDTHGRPSSP